MTFVVKGATRIELSRIKYKRNSIPIEKLKGQASAKSKLKENNAAIRHVPIFFGYSKTIPKNRDPSYKTNLEL